MTEKLLALGVIHHPTVIEYYVIVFLSFRIFIKLLHCAVGNMSGNRCESDCRSRARSHTFVEIDHEIISTVILLPSAESFKKGCCQLQAKVCARSTGYLLVQACPGKSVVR